MNHDPSDMQGDGSDNDTEQSPESSIVDDILDGEQKPSSRINNSLTRIRSLITTGFMAVTNNWPLRLVRFVTPGRRTSPDLLLYGPSGTGKTLTVKAVAEKVKERATEKDIGFDFVAVNFKTMESHSRRPRCLETGASNRQESRSRMGYSPKRCLHRCKVRPSLRNC